jgi:hypothetical protein
MNDNEETLIPVNTVESLALAAGLLPERLKGNKLKPVKLNRGTWKLKAAMQANGWALDTQVTEEGFTAAIEAAAHAR